MIHRCHPIWEQMLPTILFFIFKLQDRTRIVDVPSSPNCSASRYYIVMSPTVAEVWWADSEREDGGVFWKATIKLLPGRQPTRADGRRRVRIAYDGDMRGQSEQAFACFCANGVVDKLETEDGESIPLRHAALNGPCTASVRAQEASLSPDPITAPSAETRVHGAVNVLLAVSRAKIAAWLDPGELRTGLSVLPRGRTRRGSMNETTSPLFQSSFLRQSYVETCVDTTLGCLVDAGHHHAELAMLTRAPNVVLGRAHGAPDSNIELAAFSDTKAVLSQFYASDSSSDVVDRIMEGTIVRNEEFAIPAAALYATEDSSLPHALMVATRFSPYPTGCTSDHAESRISASSVLRYVWGFFWTDARLSDLTGLPVSEPQHVIRRACWQTGAGNSAEFGLTIALGGVGSEAVNTRLSFRWLDNKGDRFSLARLLWRTDRAGMRLGPDLLDFSSIVGVMKIRSSYVIVAKAGANSAKLAVRSLATS